MEIDQSHEESATEWKFKCNLCDEGINERREFMKHKKTKHRDTILECQKFLRGECSRTDESCWFKHTSNEDNPPPIKEAQSKDQVFQKAPGGSLPPDQMLQLFKMINTLCLKVEKIEKKLGE